MATAAVAAPAEAAPPGNGLEQIDGVTCNGDAVDVTATSGAAFWIGGQKYVMTSSEFTFTPTGEDPETETKTYGRRNGLSGEAITCTGGESFPEGSFSFVVNAVPIN